MKKITSILLFAYLIFSNNAFSQTPFSRVGEDTIIVSDGLSKQMFLWKNGQLNLLTAKSLKDNTEISFKTTAPDISHQEIPRKTSFQIHEAPASERVSAYSELQLTAEFENFAYVRTLRVYADSPGVEWRLKLRGENELFPENAVISGDLIEDPSLLSDNVPHYFFLPFASPHFSTKIVSFKEATDHQSNLVNEKTELPYRRPQYYRGNVLFAKNNQKPQTHLIVKLSPLQNAQSNYIGFDFSTDFSGTKVHSPGYDLDADSNENEWQEAYPLFVLLFAHDEETALNGYKKYELSIHRYLPERDNTFTMNTWGDRNRDSRVNEQFILKELDAAHRLGVTQYQIDDGWQQGLSKNSAQKADMLWDDWKTDDWKVNKTRFPNGLKPVTDKARSLGIGLGLWFNPSKNNYYSLWERDKSILLDLHRTHGISWIKIDGMSIGSKTEEKNVFNMLQGAMNAGNGNLQFNMDVTAGKRGGYFFFNHFGNTFLENRYTDWGNHYPHLTLRNAWQLAKYVPIQRFQIEWLNKWRNDDKYPMDDPLKPKNVPFDYQFAVAMIGQPLAWMEATALPEEAFAVSELVETWKKYRSDMQQGIIHALGDMPDGYSFPGFVSYADSKTYVLLFRENTPVGTASFTLPLGNLNGKTFVKLAGNGTLKAVKKNAMQISYSEPFEFLWGYFE